MRTMRNKKGFSLVEVILFLGISSAIAVGIIVATKNTIEQQRYNDAIQTFAEFLRNVYSDTANVQINGGKNDSGRSNYAIYGKLVTFGNYKVDENGVFKSTTGSTFEGVYTYDIMGNASGSIGSTTEVLSSLKALNVQYACNLMKRPGFDDEYICKTDAATGRVLVTHSAEYNSHWDAKIENTTSNNTIFSGALLVVRSPSSGVTYTFTLNEARLNQAIAAGKTLNLSNLLDYFGNDDLDFCISMEGVKTYNNLRRNIRINGAGHSSSAVEVIPLNDGNRCQ